MPLTTPPETMIYFVIVADRNRERMNGCSQQQEKFVIVLFLVHELSGCAACFPNRTISGEILFDTIRTVAGVYRF